MSQSAGSHLSRPIAESSKIVPSLTENCLRHFRHFQMRRVLRNIGSVASQCGHMTPVGQRSEATNSKAASGSEKYRIASWRLLGVTVTTGGVLSMAQNIGPRAGCVKY